MDSRKKIVIGCLGGLFVLGLAWKVSADWHFKRTADQELSLLENELNHKLDLLSKASAEKVDFLKGLASEKKWVITELESELNAMKTSNLKSEKGWRQWQQSLNRVSQVISDSVVRELSLSVAKLGIPLWQRKLEVEDKKLETLILDYELMIRERKQKIVKLKSKRSFFQVAAEKEFPSSPLYQEMLERKLAKAISI